MGPLKISYFDKACKDYQKCLEKQLDGSCVGSALFVPCVFDLVPIKCSLQCNAGDGDAAADCAARDDRVRKAVFVLLVDADPKLP